MDLSKVADPAVSPCRFVRQGRPELGLPLFQAECLKWPGFVEFDDVNCKILTYSAVNRCAAAVDADCRGLLTHPT